MPKISGTTSGTLAAAAAGLEAAAVRPAAHDDDPQPFVWTKTAGEILEKVRRARVALDEVRAASVNP